ncbi:MAG: flippase-like domain-containing protein, partial [bacterium]|nr:flippase-like domain-containing protein [bacterium]
LRAERWKYLLAPIKKLTFKHLLPATMIGFMANNVLPARAGEFIRAYVIGKKENISKTTSFATIIIERVFDMITMLGFLVIILLFVKFPQQTGSGTGFSLISFERLQIVGSLAAVFIFALLLFLVLLKEFPQQTTTFMKLLLSPLPKSLGHKILDIVESFRMGLQVLQTGSHLFFLMFWSLSVWLTAAFAAWIILWTFGLDLPFMAGVFMTVITAFSAAIPSSPGYVGPFHAAVSASVLFFLPGLDKSTAAGIAIIFHLVCILPTTFIGMYYLWKENMSFSEIQHIEEEEQKDTRDAPSEAADAS